MWNSRHLGRTFSAASNTQTKFKHKQTLKSECVKNTIGIIVS